MKKSKLITKDHSSMKITGIGWIVEGVVILGVIVAKYVFHLF